MGHSIVGQILGGLQLSLQERFPDLTSELCTYFDEPAIRIAHGTYIIISGEKFKVVYTLTNNNRVVLFECSFIEPNANFYRLFEFVRSWLDIRTYTRSIYDSYTD